MPPLPERARAALASPWTPRIIAAISAAAVVLSSLTVPIVEDSLFWWVPKALMALERGPAVVYAHSLPEAVREGLTATTTPHQWSGGLPDYAHPTLWYLWLSLWLSASPTVTAIHLACLLPALAVAIGFVELGGRLGSRWAGLAPLMLPPVVAQLLRPELDLPLLAIVPWALVMLCDGRWRTFAVLGFLAPLCKEPGVLLIVPALLRSYRERRVQLAAVAPLAGLGVWALLHNGLAQPERLPTSLVGWLTRDVWLGFRVMFLEQGRWMLLAVLPWVWRRWNRGPAPSLIAVFTLCWFLFFVTVGFFAARNALDLHTHVRYFLPGMAAGMVLLAVRTPWLALPGLLWLHSASVFGPEASRFGTDVGQAQRAGASWIADQVSQGQNVWVGSYLAAALTQPWAGVVEQPLEGFRVFDDRTRAAQVRIDDIVVVSAYGEPAGRLERGLTWTEEKQWTVHEATLTAYRVTGHSQPDVGIPAPQRPPVPAP